MKDVVNEIFLMRFSASAKKTLDDDRQTLERRALTHTPTVHTVNVNSRYYDTNRAAKSYRYTVPRIFYYHLGVSAFRQ